MTATELLIYICAGIGVLMLVLILCLVVTVFYLLKSKGSQPAQPGTDSGIAGELNSLKAVVESLDLKSRTRKGAKGLKRALQNVLKAFKTLVKQKPVDVLSLDDLGKFNIVFKDVPDGSNVGTWKAYKTDDILTKDFIESLENAGLDVLVEKIAGV